MIFRFVRVLVVVSLSFSAHFFYLYAGNESCQSGLSLLTDDANTYYSRRFEVHSLAELVDADPAKNLAYLHPSIVMNSAQRLNSWVRFKPSRLVRDPYFGVGQVEYFPVFGDGLTEAGGKMIVGQYDAIGKVMSYVRAAARGDGAAVKQPLLVGPGGSGKSEFLSILALVGSSLTAKYSDYYLYTFRWINLENIPQARKYFEVQVDADGNEIPLTLEAPIRRSPLVLLPENIQQKVIALAAKRAVQLSGYEPRPILKADSQSEELKTIVVDHYRRLAPYSGRDLSDRDIVDILGKHIEIIRRPMDGAGAFPTLSAQGNDVPYDEIFFAKSPMNFATFGPSSPFSYFLTGKVLQADGGILLTDEWWRNRPELRDVFLDVIEDREVQRGGSPREKIDVFILGAGNDESLEEARSKGAVKAQVDRAVSIPMRLSRHPWEIAKTMFLMKNVATLSMRKLDSQVAPLTPLQPRDGVSNAELAPWTPVVLKELFPVPEADVMRLEGPNRRYALRADYSPEGESVFIAPHTVEFISYVVASTRFITDQKTAASHGNFGVIASPIFSDPNARLKAIVGESEIQPDQAAELKSLSNLLKEGSAGMSNRDAANIWFHHLIEVAATRPECERTITPALALQELWELLERGEITFPNEAARLLWLRNAVSIANAFVVTWINRDVMEALHSDSDGATGVYDEIKLELLALAQNPKAVDYLGPNGRRQAIKLDRLNEVKAHYQRLVGRRLVEGEIMQFHTRYGSEPRERHRQLMDAITEALAKRLADAASWESLAQFGRTSQGGHEVQRKYGALEHHLIHALGYNSKAVRMALDFKAQMESVRSRLNEIARE